MSGISGKSLLKLCVCSSSTSPPPSPSPPPPPSPEPQQPPPPPNALLCPISGRLLADPVIIVPSGHTVERACIQACQELNFNPPILSSSSAASASSSSSPSFPFFPNTTLKNSILHWCDRTRHPHPVPVSLEEARAIVRNLKDGNQESSSSSSSSAAAAADLLEEEFLTSLVKPDSSERDLALRNLIQIISTNKDRGISLCTPRIMAAIIAALQNPEHWRVQINATAAISAFSYLPANGANIVQFGAVPPLLDALAKGPVRARTNAASAICNLAIDERNRLAIGSLGAIPPLLEKFLNRFLIAGRQMAAQALYSLTLQCPGNVAILANMEAVASKLLAVAADRSGGDGNRAIVVRKYALMLLCNLAEATKGRVDLINAGAVELMVRMVREGGGGLDKYCLSVMYRICMSCPTLFKGPARAAGAEAVLSVQKEEWGEGGRDMARKLLRVIRQDSKGKAVAY